jgi:hypothetical protein
MVLPIDISYLLWRSLWFFPSNWYIMYSLKKKERKETFFFFFFYSLPIGYLEKVSIIRLQR